MLYNLIAKNKIESRFLPMNIILIFNEILNDFNIIFNKNLNSFTLESKIRECGDLFTVKLYEQFLNFFDMQFKKNKDRKLKYNIKQTRQRTLITSIGAITFNYPSDIDKKTGEYYLPIREILYLKPYQRLTNEAEYQLIKHSMDENMSQAGKHALRNTIISRSTVSKKIKALDGSINEVITKSTNQPNILYIEMDEIHANLQHGGNKICPCAIVHEGYEEEFVKRKKLKNIRYFASSKLTYEELWEVIFDYINKKYDINKFKKIFVSGDGAIGIKNYTNCFPNATFVLDKFHYIRKHLKYIFKNNNELRNIADDYIRNNLINDFKILVDCQIKQYPEQSKKMKEHMNYILNNLEGIKNQKDEDYKVSCSMEGHVNQAFARYITSSPYGFSQQGLENKLKLLVYHANKIELKIEDYLNLKYGINNYEEINKNIKVLTNIKYDQKLTSNYSARYSINVQLPKFDSPEENNYLSYIQNYSNIL